MIVLVFVGRSSNPTSDYNLMKNIYLYFLLTNLFNVLTETTPSLLQSHDLLKIL